MMRRVWRQRELATINSTPSRSRPLTTRSTLASPRFEPVPSYRGFQRGLARTLFSKEEGQNIVTSRNRALPRTMSRHTTQWQRPSQLGSWVYGRDLMIHVAMMAFVLSYVAVDAQYVSESRTWSRVFDSFLKTGNGPHGRVRQDRFKRFSIDTWPLADKPARGGKGVGRDSNLSIKARRNLEDIGTVSLSPSAGPAIPAVESPSFTPSVSFGPSRAPSSIPSASIPPSDIFSSSPSRSPSMGPTDLPSFMTSPAPSASSQPSPAPSSVPSVAPTKSSTPTRTFVPSSLPSNLPSIVPSSSFKPSLAPSSLPSDVPSLVPSTEPSSEPSLSAEPSLAPSLYPTTVPSVSSIPTIAPTKSSEPSISFLPTVFDPETMSRMPSPAPSSEPSFGPTNSPSSFPSFLPSMSPTYPQDFEITQDRVSIVLTGVLEDLTRSQLRQWSTGTGDFIKDFWNDLEANPFSPAEVSSVRTNVNDIVQTRVTDGRRRKLEDGLDEAEVLPLRFTYTQTITYGLRTDEIQPEYGNLNETLFIHPLLSDSLAYTNTIVEITNNSGPIFLESAEIGEPKTTPPPPSSKAGNEILLITLIVIIVATVLLLAVAYLVHLLKKEREDEEIVFETSQENITDDEFYTTAGSGVDYLGESSEGHHRYHPTITTIPVIQPGGSFQEDDSNFRKEISRPAMSAGKRDDIAEEADENLEGMVIRSGVLAIDRGDEQDSPAGTATDVFRSRSADNDDSVDQSSDIDDDPFQPHHSAFQMQVLDIEEYNDESESE